jgi:RNA polymerase sigma-70 factor, ECF subfamily
MSGRTEPLPARANLLTPLLLGGAAFAPCAQRLRPHRTAQPIALTDDQLMADAGAGSIDAFAELYDRYSGRAYKVASAVCRDDGGVQDAVQEAFVSIWRSSASYRSQRGTVSAWLLSVVRHRAIDLARRESALAALHANDESLNARASPDDLCEEAAANEQAGHLQALLYQLPDAQREVITLAFYGQLSHTEIAAQLGLPTGTVKGRMRLGMHKLRAKIDAPTA